MQVALCLIVAIATVVCIFASLCARRPDKPLSESLLVACACTVLAINLELWALSLLPVPRPATWAPAIHMVLLGLAWWRWRPRLPKVRLPWAAAAFVPVLSLYGWFGVYTNLNAWDELAYHVPTAVQVHQDGRVGSLPAPQPWVASYPKGAALLWAWTMLWTGGTGLFRLVQLAFGTQLLLAVYVLARRIGATRGSALLGAFVLMSMPVFFRLATICSADLAFAAGCLSAIAFLVPLRSGEDAPFLASGAMVGLAQAVAVKVPVLALVTTAIMFMPFVFTAGWRPLVRSRWVWAALVTLLLSGGTYVRNWVNHGNPLYPIRLEIGGKLIFDGPHPPVTTAGISAHTRMTHLKRDSIVHMYYGAWTDWFNALTEDSLGSVGPVLLICVLAPSIARLVLGVRRRDRGVIALGVVVVVVSLIPGAFLPRYGLAMLAVLVALAVSLFSTMPSETRSALHATAVLFSLAGCAMSALTIGAVASQPLIDWEKVTMGDPDYPLPETIAAIHKYSKRGEMLAWSIQTLNALLWNRDYSNRIIFVPGTTGDLYPSAPSGLAKPTDSELAAWTDHIRRLRPDDIVLYSGTAYADVIRSGAAGLYQVLYAEPQERGKYQVVLFSRVK